MLTQEHVIYYLLGALLASGCTSLWFFSNLPVHIIKILRIASDEDDVYTWDDLQIFLCIKSSFWGELLSCPLCLGFWISIIISLLLQQLNAFSLWFIPACIFSWPTFIYYFYSKFSTEDG